AAHAAAEVGGRLALDDGDLRDEQAQFLRGLVELLRLASAGGDARQTVGGAVGNRSGGIALLDAEQDVAPGDGVALARRDFNEVIAEVGAHRLRDLAHAQGEGRVLEGGHEAAARTATQTATVGGRDGVLRFAGGDVGEAGAAADDLLAKIAEPLDDGG